MVSALPLVLMDLMATWVLMDLEWDPQACPTDPHRLA